MCSKVIQAITKDPHSNELGTRSNLQISFGLPKRSRELGSSAELLLKPNSCASSNPSEAVAGPPELQRKVHR